MIRGFWKLVLTLMPLDSWSWPSVWNAGLSALTIWMAGLILGLWHLPVPGGRVLRLRGKRFPTPSPLWANINYLLLYSLPSGKTGVKRPKDSNAYSVTLKQNIHFYPLMIHAKDVTCPLQSISSERNKLLLRVQSSNRNVWEHRLEAWQLPWDNLTVTPDCKFCSNHLFATTEQTE